MPSLTVWRFDTAEGAQRAEEKLHELVDEHLISLHDVVTVSWERGAKKPRIHDLESTTQAGALSGAFWGLLFGMIFFMPLLGAALGAATGALAGSLADVGIDDTFINKVRDQVTPGTSALFLLTSDVVADQVKDAFDDDRAQLILTNLSQEQETALREVFGETAA